MIAAEMKVEHRLYPELGRGRVLHLTRVKPPTARVDWAEVGQTTSHSLVVLREVVS